MQVSPFCEKLWEVPESRPHPGTRPGSGSSATKSERGSSNQVTWDSSPLRGFRPNYRITHLGIPVGIRWGSEVMTLTVRSARGLRPRVRGGVTCMGAYTPLVGDWRPRRDRILGDQPMIHPFLYRVEQRGTRP